MACSTSSPAPAMQCQDVIYIKKIHITFMLIDV